MTRPRTNRLLVLFATLLLAGCASLGRQVDDGVKPISAQQELPGDQLLDMEIAVFDSRELTEQQLKKEGLSQEIRQAEERYIPIHLKYTLQRTGYWGAVRVVPAAAGADVQVSGTIIESDGEELVVEIRARDARGVTWFEKTYAETLRPAEHQQTVAEERDPFQDLYNTVANDLTIHRQALSPEVVREIQAIAELSFAEEMAPDAFAGHLIKGSDEQVHLLRLPAEDDPMLKRVRAVQVRDDMLIDTINGHYDNYYRDLWQPYADWRSLRSEEAAALRDVEQQALTRQLLGLAAIAGGVLLSSNSNVNASNLPGVMVIGGAAAIYSGFQKQAETKIHREVIEELSLSFSAEAEPLVVDVVGETVRLTGSAEEQYRQWREMLGAIYAAETGLPQEEDQAGAAEPDPAEPAPQESAPAAGEM